MPVSGQSIQNAATGERIVFVRTAAETGGEFLELEDFWTRRGHRTTEHVHPQMEERWTVVSGCAAFRIGGAECTLGEGETIVAPAGVPHVAWNPGDAPVHLRIQMRPALRWEEFVERLFLLVRHGPTDERGLPEPAQLVALMHEFPREIAPAS